MAEMIIGGVKASTDAKTGDIVVTGSAKDRTGKLLAEHEFRIPGDVAKTLSAQDLGNLKGQLGEAAQTIAKGKAKNAGAT